MSSMSAASMPTGSTTAEAPPVAYEAIPRTEDEALTRLDEASTHLQQEGRYLEALECMEKGLILRHRMFGGRSAEVLGACKAAGELCNLLAMTYLQREEYAMVAELLKKAEILTEADPAGKAVTYNNFACFSRQQGRLHAALAYLQRALKIEEKLLPHVENPADTHLNLCAVLSQLSRHKEALEHAQSALALLQEELFGGAGTVVAAHKPDRVAVLAICYHNIGVECEFLKHFQASLQAYTKGVEIATVYLGADHGITATLKRSQAAAKRAIDKAAMASPRRRPGGSVGATATAGSRLRRTGAGGGSGAAVGSGVSAGGSIDAGSGGGFGSTGGYGYDTTAAAAVSGAAAALASGPGVGGPRGGGAEATTPYEPSSGSATVAGRSAGASYHTLPLGSAVSAAGGGAYGRGSPSSPVADASASYGSSMLSPGPGYGYASPSAAGTSSGGGGGSAGPGSFGTPPGGGAVVLSYGSPLATGSSGTGTRGSAPIMASPLRAAGTAAMSAARY